MKQIPVEGAMVERLTSVLRQNALFKTLADTQMDGVAAHGSLLQYDAGEVIIEENGPSYSFFVVLNGEVAVKKNNSATGEMTEVSRLKKGDEFVGFDRFISGLIMNSPRGGAPQEKPLLIDTSVIIDGRVAEVSETGFIEGTVTVPRFVLEELQRIADSSDAMKRARGRRGLDILKQLQMSDKVKTVVTDDDVPHIKEVDGKLIALAKEKGAGILTNDSNLHKVAELHGVRVLNMNALAAAMRPVVMPGEVLTIAVVKEGKEQGQGIGYLDDGTMVVIDNGRDHVGRTVDAAITSILQTTGGRMIFSKVKEDSRKPSLSLTSV